MFEVRSFAEALDEFRTARDVHDNDPEGDLESEAWTKFKETEDNLYDTFKAAIKAVLLAD